MSDDQQKCDNNDVNNLLKLRINQSERLMLACQEDLAKIDGSQKLRNLIKKELEGTRCMITRHCTKSVTLKSLETSNIKHYEAIVTTALEHKNRLSRLLARYPLDGRIGSQGARKSSIQVDMVLDDGTTWIKVIARNWKGIYQECTGGGSTKSGRNIVEQGELLAMAAVNNPVLFKTPRLIFIFNDMVPSNVKEMLENLDIEVQGKVMEVARWDSSSDEDFNSEESQENSEKANCIAVNLMNDTDYDCSGQYSNAINLDVTAMLCLCSNLTNGHIGFRFVEQGLTDQANREKATAALPLVLNTIAGKRLITCQTAFDAFKNIINTVAGSLERQRATLLEKYMKIVEDRCTVRVRDLQLTDVVNNRTKAVFGSGDYYRCITLSANKSFYQAALQQSVRLALILHESRILSEQKEAHATKLDNCDIDSTLPKFDENFCTQHLSIECD